MPLNPDLRRQRQTDLFSLRTAWPTRVIPIQVPKNAVSKKKKQRKKITILVTLKSNTTLL